MGLILLVAWIIVLMSSIAYPIVHVFIGVIIPLILILARNKHIVTIAKSPRQEHST